MDELINFKGMVDGVGINVDSDAPMHEILEALDEKIKGHKGFFGAGDCLIRFCGREFTGGERQRLTELTRKLLPLSRIEFETAKQSQPHSDWVAEYKERYGREKTDERKLTEPIIENGEELGDTREESEFLSVFRSNRARFYQGVVHDGMELYSDGHLILLGKAEEGSRLAAVGNIIVMGGLYGKAHAGCNGHKGSYIIAMDMHPESLAIADAAETYEYAPQLSDSENRDETEAKHSFLNKLKKKGEIEKKSENCEEKNCISAVALYKNNKIELDNFTIKIFTN